MKAIRDELNLFNKEHLHFGILTAQLFSSTKRIGLEEAESLVYQWLAIQEKE
jgi:GTP-binding protein